MIQSIPLLVKKSGHYNNQCMVTMCPKCTVSTVVVFIVVLVLVRNSMGSSVITTSFALKFPFSMNKSGVYPKFHCYPCYSQLILYLCTCTSQPVFRAVLLDSQWTPIGLRYQQICFYVLNTRQH